MGGETDASFTANCPPKAYKNLEFLNSPAARKIRVECELTEPEDRFQREGVINTIVLFGSARLRSPEVAGAKVEAARKALAEAPEGDKGKAEAYLRAKEAIARHSGYYVAAQELSRRLTEWSLQLVEGHQPFLVCSGGGPGIMEAANRGAQEAGGRSVALGISLPFEQGINPYAPPELSFEFHYFFVRKYWFLYPAKALVVFPGGFGTMDELFEALTLVQTGKIRKRMPVLLYGSEFWTRVINFDVLAEWGLISPSDVELFRIVDTVDDAYACLVEDLDTHYINGQIRASL